MTTRRAFFDSAPNGSGGWNPMTLAALAGAWLAVLPNWPLWRALAALPETASARGWLFIGGFGLMIAALMAMLLALAAWRVTIKPAIAFLLLAAAFGAHFMASYGVVIDTTMMTNVLQTDRREVADLLNLRLAVNVFLLAIVPIVLVWRLPLQRLSFWPQLGRNALGFGAGALLLTVLVFALFADLSATMRNHKQIRYLINPANSLWALVDLGVRSHALPKGPPLAIGLDAKTAARPAGSKPPLLLLVIGETGRADHFALNGYPRPTNPELARLDVVSFANVTSCGTNTAASLPCLFSSLGKAGFESRKADHENLLDLVQRAGMTVLWVDNQAGCKGLCERVPHAQASDPPPGAKPRGGLCADSARSASAVAGATDESGAGDCFDEAMLDGLAARLDALPAPGRERGVLIVLHQMGSHGPAYSKRSPAGRKPFMPECTTSVLQRCDHASLINAYDNSIAYTDHVLAESVHWLQGQAARYATALLYVSDHGESLGENGLYLHGLPYAVAPREQTHVPMIVWLPAAPGSGASLACLRQAREAPLSHDNLFHTVVGQLGIQASEYKPALDAFAACRRG